MKNETVIRNFLNNREGHTPKRYTYDGDYISTLWTTYEGDTLVLMNYRTVIAKWDSDWHNNKIILNTKKYSSTTSKIQHAIERVCEWYGIEIETM